VSLHQGTMGTVLVVEDEVLIRLDVSDYLRAQGYNVLEASNAGDAIKIVDSGALVCVVFTDVQMPGTMDGLGLVRYLKERYPHIPALITSGHLPKEELPKEFGILINKPYHLEHVLERIRAEISKRDGGGYGNSNLSVG
jgi:CheY-like chemotaxis protein